MAAPCANWIVQVHIRCTQASSTDPEPHPGLVTGKHVQVGCHHRCSKQNNVCSIKLVKYLNSLELCICGLVAGTSEAGWVLSV
jgi:hypothetical protein